MPTYALPLPYYQSRKDKTLLHFGFAPSKLPFTEIAPFRSVLKTVELGNVARVFPTEFLTFLQEHHDKPFVLCLHGPDGWLRIVVPFADSDDDFARACQELVSAVNDPASLLP